MRIGSPDGRGVTLSSRTWVRARGADQACRRAAGITRPTRRSCDLDGCPGLGPGDGPEVIFAGAVTWLRERRVLLPGVITLAWLRARVSPAAGSVPEPVMNASSLVFQGRADDLD